MRRTFSKLFSFLKKEKHVLSSGKEIMQEFRRSKCGNVVGIPQKQGTPTSVSKIRKTWIYSTKKEETPPFPFLEWTALRKLKLTFFLLGKRIDSSFFPLPFLNDNFVLNFQGIRIFLLFEKNIPFLSQMRNLLPEIWPFPFPSERNFVPSFKGRETFSFFREWRNDVLARSRRDDIFPSHPRIKIFVFFTRISYTEERERSGPIRFSSREEHAEVLRMIDQEGFSCF